jgi:hypothetical protein
MRDVATNLRALPAQRELIDHAANLLGKNRSDHNARGRLRQSASSSPKCSMHHLPTTWGLNASWPSRLLGRHELATERAATATHRAFSRSVRVWRS